MNVSQSLLFLASYRPNDTTGDCIEACGEEKSIEWWVLVAVVVVREVVVLLLLEEQHAAAAAAETAADMGD